MGTTIAMEGCGSLDDNMLHSLKMKPLNERTSRWNLCNVRCKHYQLYHFCLITKKLINKSAKIQALEKLNKADPRDIQIQTEGFNGEPISALHYKNREE